MAETLQEFLVSVKYQVDAASQNNFLNALKRVAGSVAGVAAEIAGLAGSILVLTRTMADTGSEFYWMSQRLGTSIGDIKAATTAMQEFGASAGEASGSIERFGSWTRSMGPAATAYLRSMGVTATDTATRMVQLGNALREMGGTAGNQGTMAYALALRRANLMGIDERTMLRITQPGYGAAQENAGILEQTIWGVKTKSELKAKQDEWGRTATRVTEQFVRMGLIFDTFRQKFALQLFDKVLPQLVKLNDLLVANKDTIDRWITAAVMGLGRFIELTTIAVETFTKLPEAMKIAIGVFTAFPLIKTLLASPLTWLIATLGALLLILQDYQVYQEGGHAGINWGKIGEMFDAVANVAKPLTDILKPLMDINKQADDWVTKMTGVCHLLYGIEIALVAVLGRYVAINTARTLWNLGKSLLTGAPAATPGAAGGGGLIWRLIKAAPTAFRLTSIFEAAWKAISDPQKWWKDWGDAFRTGHYGWGDDNKTVHKPGEHVAAPVNTWIGHILKRFLKGPEAIQKQAEDYRASTSEQENLGANIGKGIVKAMQDITGSSSVLFRAPGEEGFGVDVGTGGKAGGGGGGGGGQYGAGTGGLGDPDAGGVGDASELGLTPEQFKVYRDTLGARESGNRYRIVNSYGYMGKYQFGTREIAETAKSLGEPTPSKAEFLNDPAMQERFFLQYTIRHHRQMMADPAYAKLSPIERAGLDATAHLKGVGGALAQLHGGSAGTDAYGTSGASYSAMMTRALYGARLGVPAGGVPSAKTSAPVQNNHTTVNVAAGPTAEATGSRVTSGMQYLNQQRMRQFADIFR